jgi:hypothetical protein
VERKRLEYIKIYPTARRYDQNYQSRDSCTILQVVFQYMLVALAMRTQGRSDRYFLLTGDTLQAIGPVLS